MADKYMVEKCDIILAVTAGEEKPDSLILARDYKKPVVYFDVQTLEITQ